MRNQIIRIICLITVMIIIMSTIEIQAEGLLDINHSMFTENAATKEDGVDVFENISPSLADSLLDRSVSDFESDTDGWQSASTTDEVSLADSISVSPYGIFEGKSMLRFRCNSEKERHTLRKKFDSPIYGADQNTFYLTLNADENCTVTITVKGMGITLSKTVQITAGVYSGVAMDITRFSGKGALTEISIRAEFDSNDSYRDLYVDTVGFSSQKNIASIARFMTSDYICGGGNLTISDSSMTFLMNEEGAYVETASLNYNFDEYVNAICVKLENYSGATSVTLFYTTEESPQYKSINSYSLDLYGDNETHYYVFPVREREITQIRLVFGGNAMGLMHIYGIEPYSTYNHVTTDYGTLDSVEISDNKNDIVIRGTIDDDILEIYKDQTKPIALYCLDPGDDETNIITLATSKIDQTDLGKSFKFVVPIEGASYSRINCKFAVGITTENGITLIDDCMYITNPEVLSEYDRCVYSTQTKKGIAADAYTADLLETDAYVEIDLTRLLSEKETIYSIETFGNETYFNASYIAELDALMGSYHNLGIAVTAKLFQSSASSVALYNMFDSGNVTDLYHTMIFIASRYSGELNVITDYVVDIDAALMQVDAAVISDRIKNVSNYLRVVYNSISVINSSVDIFISANRKWDKHLAYDAGYGIGTRQLIDMIGEYISAEGDFPWNVAINVNTADEFAFNEKEAENRYDSKFISIKNINMLDRYMNLEANLYGNKSRKIIVINHAYNTQAETGESAEYIYAYIRMITEECANVERYILSRKVYSESLQETIRYIDTKAYFKECEQYALEMLGISDWSVLSIGEPDKSNLRTVLKSSFKNTLDIAEVGSYTVFDFSQLTLENEWKAYANCSVISTGNQSIDRNAFLSASLLKNGNFGHSGIVCDFEYVMNFSAAPYLTLELQIAGDSLQTEQADVVIAFFADDHCVEYFGTITTSKWNNIILDLSDFDYNNRIDRIRVVVKNKNLPTNTTLMMGNITAHSEKYEAEEIDAIINASRINIRQYSVDITVVIILILIIIISGSAVILHLLSMNKKKK